MDSKFAGWAVAAALLALLCGREMRSATLCSLSASDVDAVAAKVEEEVSWLCNATRDADAAHDAVVSELVAELEAVHAVTEKLRDRVDDDRKTLEDAGRADEAPATRAGDAWAEARRLAEAARTDADAARAAADAAAADAQQAQKAAARARPRDETLAAVEKSIDALEAESKKAEAAAAAASERLDAAENAAALAREALASAPAAAVAADALEAAVEKLRAEVAARAAPTVDVDGVVEAALDKFFDGDRVGRFDYALRAAGAEVVPALTTEPYTPAGAAVPTKVWHALGRDAGVGRAEDALVVHAGFGSCFAFGGARGDLTVKLAAPVVVDAVSVEHIHAALCDPNRNANCASAPRTFEVLGRAFADETRPSKLGSFAYNMSADAPTVQTFSLATPKKLEVVTLRVTANHGHADYTCVYRFRVHGEP